MIVIGICWTVLGLLLATPTASMKSPQGWVKTPGVVHSCAGVTVVLAWEYEGHLGQPIGVNVARSDDKRTTVLYKKGSEEAVSQHRRVKFNSNAGIAITNVMQADAGKYKSTVVFSNRPPLQNEATLIVYDDCPDSTEFKNPQIFLSYNLYDHDSLSLFNTLADLGHLHFTVKVPEGKPKVNCTLQINGEIFDCESGASIDASTQFSFPITVTLHHEALGSHSRTILLDNNATDESTTVSVSPEEPKLSNATVPSLAIAVTVLIIIIIIHASVAIGKGKRFQTLIKRSI